MILALPKSFVPPDSARPGEPFEAVARIKVTDDGSFELIAIDGTELEPEEDEMSKFAAKIKLPWDQP